jgi:hypothetical protein
MLDTSALSALCPNRSSGRFALGTLPGWLESPPIQESVAHVGSTMSNPSAAAAARILLSVVTISGRPAARAAAR